MARPTQNTIDYFSHDCQHTKTMYILESRYKNDGYAFWFKLLETLGSTPNHFIDLGDDAAQEFMAAKANITWDYCEEILTLLAKIQAICPVLWEKKIVWCQNFTDRLATIYGKRGRELPSKPSFCDGKVTIPVVSVTETPQSKLKESRLNNITIKQKENNIPDDSEKAMESDLPFFDNEDNSHVDQAKKPKAKKNGVVVEIPEELNTPDFLKLWQEWQEHLKEKKTKTTSSAFNKQLVKLANFGLKKALHTLSYCIEKNWQGIYEDPIYAEKERRQAEADAYCADGPSDETLAQWEREIQEAERNKCK